MTAIKIEDREHYIVTPKGDRFLVEFVDHDRGTCRRISGDAGCTPEYLASLIKSHQEVMAY